MLRLIHSLADGQKKQSVDDEALAWVVRLTSGETGHEDHEAFRTWRDQSPVHAEALKRARILHQQIGVALPRAQRSRADRIRRAGVGFSIAASLLLCVGLGGQYLTSWRYDHVTDAGERRVMRLPDGTRMVMAGNTALDVDYLGGVRRIELSRGEALFDVVHDDRRPFVVHAGNDSVRDIGTVFSMNRGEEGVRVVVAVGSVEASSDDRRALLVADQSVLMPATGGLGRVEKVNAASETAWAEGRLILQNKTLNEIIEALAPHYSGSIVLLNRAAGRQRLSAVIDLEQADKWLAGLAKARAIRLTRIGSVVILT